MCTTNPTECKHAEDAPNCERFAYQCGGGADGSCSTIVQALCPFTCGYDVPYVYCVVLNLMSVRARGAPVPALLRQQVRVNGTRVAHGGTGLVCHNVHTLVPQHTARYTLVGVSCVCSSYRVGRARGVSAKHKSVTTVRA